MEDAEAVFEAIRGAYDRINIVNDNVQVIRQEIIDSITRYKTALNAEITEAIKKQTDDFNSALTRIQQIEHEVANKADFLTLQDLADSQNTLIDQFNNIGKMFSELAAKLYSPRDFILDNLPSEEYVRGRWEQLREESRVEQENLRARKELEDARKRESEVLRRIDIDLKRESVPEDAADYYNNLLSDITLEPKEDIKEERKGDIYMISDNFDNFDSIREQLDIQKEIDSMNSKNTANYFNLKEFIKSLNIRHVSEISDYDLYVQFCNSSNLNYHTIEEANSEILEKMFSESLMALERSELLAVHHMKYSAYYKSILDIDKSRKLIKNLNLEESLQDSPRDEDKESLIYNIQKEYREKRAEYRADYKIKFFKNLQINEAINPSIYENLLNIDYRIDEIIDQETYNKEQDITNNKFLENLEAEGVRILEGEWKKPKEGPESGSTMERYEPNPTKKIKIENIASIENNEFIAHPKGLPEDYEAVSKEVINIQQELFRKSESLQRIINDYNIVPTLTNEQLKQVAISQSKTIRDYASLDGVKVAADGFTRILDARTKLKGIPTKKLLEGLVHGVYYRDFDITNTLQFIKAISLLTHKAALLHAQTVSAGLIGIRDRSDFEIPILNAIKKSRNEIINRHNNYIYKHVSKDLIATNETEELLNNWFTVYICKQHTILINSVFDTYTYRNIAEVLTEGELSIFNQIVNKFKPKSQKVRTRFTLNRGFFFNWDEDVNTLVYKSLTMNTHLGNLNHLINGDKFWEEDFPRIITEYIAKVPDSLREFTKGYLDVSFLDLSERNLTRINGPRNIRTHNIVFRPKGYIRKNCLPLSWNLERSEMLLKQASFFDESAIQTYLKAIEQTRHLSTTLNPYIDASYLGVVYNISTEMKSTEIKLNSKNSNTNYEIELIRGALLKTREVYKYILDHRPSVLYQNGKEIYTLKIKNDLRYIPANFIDIADYQEVLGHHTSNYSMLYLKNYDSETAREKQRKIRSYFRNFGDGNNIYNPDDDPENEYLTFYREPTIDFLESFNSRFPDTNFKYFEEITINELIRYIKYIDETEKGEFDVELVRRYFLNLDLRKHFNLNEAANAYIIKENKDREDLLSLEDRYYQLGPSKKDSRPKSKSKIDLSLKFESMKSSETSHIYIKNLTEKAIDRGYIKFDGQVVRALNESEKEDLENFAISALYMKADFESIKKKASDLRLILNTYKTLRLRGRLINGEYTCKLYDRKFAPQYIEFNTEGVMVGHNTLYRRFGYWDGTPENLTVNLDDLDQKDKDFINNLEILNHNDALEFELTNFREISPDDHQYIMKYILKIIEYLNASHLYLWTQGPLNSLTLPMINNIIAESHHLSQDFITKYIQISEDGYKKILDDYETDVMIHYRLLKNYRIPIIHADNTIRLHYCYKKSKNIKRDSIIGFKYSSKYSPEIQQAIIDTYNYILPRLEIPKTPSPLLKIKESIYILEEEKRELLDEFPSFTTYAPDFSEIIFKNEDIYEDIDGGKLKALDLAEQIKTTYINFGIQIKPESIIETLNQIEYKFEGDVDSIASFLLNFKLGDLIEFEKRIRDEWVIFQLTSEDAYIENLIDDNIYVPIRSDQITASIMNEFPKANVDTYTDTEPATSLKIIRGWMSNDFLNLSRIDSIIVATLKLRDSGKLDKEDEADEEFQESLYVPEDPGLIDPYSEDRQIVRIMDGFADRRLKVFIDKVNTMLKDGYDNIYDLDISDIVPDLDYGETNEKLRSIELDSLAKRAFVRSMLQKANVIQDNNQILENLKKTQSFIAAKALKQLAFARVKAGNESDLELWKRLRDTGELLADNEVEFEEELLSKISEIVDMQQESNDLANSISDVIKSMDIEEEKEDINQEESKQDSFIGKQQSIIEEEKFIEEAKKEELADQLIQAILAEKVKLKTALDSYTEYHPIADAIIKSMDVYDFKFDELDPEVVNKITRSYISQARKITEKISSNAELIKETYIVKRTFTDLPKVDILENIYDYHDKRIDNISKKPFLKITTDIDLYLVSIEKITAIDSIRKEQYSYTKEVVNQTYSICSAGIILLAGESEEYYFRRILKSLKELPEEIITYKLSVYTLYDIAYQLILAHAARKTVDEDEGNTAFKYIINSLRTRLLNFTEKARLANHYKKLLDNAFDFLSQLKDYDPTRFKLYISKFPFTENITDESLYAGIKWIPDYFYQFYSYLCNLRGDEHSSMVDIVELPQESQEAKEMADKRKLEVSLKIDFKRLAEDAYTVKKIIENAQMLNINVRYDSYGHIHYNTIGHNNTDSEIRRLTSDYFTDKDITRLNIAEGLYSGEYRSYYQYSLDRTIIGAGLCFTLRGIKAAASEKPYIRNTTVLAFTGFTAMDKDRNETNELFTLQLIQGNSKTLSISPHLDSSIIAYGRHEQRAAILFRNRPGDNGDENNVELHRRALITPKVYTYEDEIPILLPEGKVTIGSTTKEYNLYRCELDTYDLARYRRFELLRQFGITELFNLLGTTATFDTSGTYLCFIDNFVEYTFNGKTVPGTLWRHPYTDKFLDNIVEEAYRILNIFSTDPNLENHIDYSSLENYLLKTAFISYQRPKFTDGSNWTRVSLNDKNWMRKATNESFLLTLDIEDTAHNMEGGKKLKKFILLNLQLRHKPNITLTIAI